MGFGLMDDELQDAYRSLIRMVVSTNPQIARQMMQPNFAKSLRTYTADLLDTGNLDKFRRS
jgi:hypothetical protein